MIGRSKQRADIVIKLDIMSRGHAKITIDPNGNASI